LLKQPDVARLLLLRRRRQNPYALLPAQQTVLLLIIGNLRLHRRGVDDFSTQPQSLGGFDALEHFPDFLLLLLPLLPLLQQSLRGHI
jgi:hypothetical protein